MAPQCCDSAAAQCWVPLLHDRLFWAPETTALANESGRLVKALDLCRHAGGRAPEYTVAHYAKAACGKAFGPLGLGTLLHFCRGLDAALQDGKGKVVLTTPKGDRPYKLNALVMLGAYLIGKCKWTVDDIVRTIGADTKSKFICAWSPAQTPEPDRVMSVRDCLRGIALAVEQFWINTSHMGDDEKLEAEVTRYYIRSFVFDAAWMIPGMLMVASDPTTVVYDPNPTTCQAMFPPTSDADADALRASDSVCTSPFTRNISNDTNDTVCKEYGENYEDILPTEMGDLPKDYVSFLRQSGVGIVVRVNYDDEPGMPRESYSSDAFKSYDIEQADIRIKDTNGGLPTPKDVAKMIEVCDGFADPMRTGGAVLVHCKGGFGRSAVLAACLAMYRHDIEGSAILGWMRVSRPGTITTRKQELFLKSLTGKRDVEKYAKIPVGDEQPQGVQSCNGCSLQ